MIFLWNASAQGIRGRCRERGGRPRFLGRWSSRRELSCQAAVAQNQEEAGPKIRRPDTSGGRKSPTRRVGWTEIADQTRRVRQIAQRLLHVIATDRGSESITGPSGPTIRGADPHVIATDRRSESIAGPCGSQNWGHLTFMSSPPRPTDSATATTPRLAPQRSLAFGLSGSQALWLPGSLAPWLPGSLTLRLSGSWTL